MKIKGEFNEEITKETKKTTEKKTYKLGDEVKGSREGLQKLNVGRWEGSSEES